MLNFLGKLAAYTICFFGTLLMFIWNPLCGVVAALFIGGFVLFYRRGLRSKC